MCSIGITSTNEKEDKSSVNTISIIQPLSKFTSVLVDRKGWVLGKRLNFAMTAFYRLNVLPESRQQCQNVQHKHYKLYKLIIQVGGLA